MKKKLMATLLATAMITGLLSGCAATGTSDNDSSDNSDSGDTVTLTFLNKYPEDIYAQYFEDAVADFEEAYPNIKIDMENVSDEAIKDKLTTIAAGGEMPDIYMTWSGERVKRFARNGMALNLTSYLEDDTEWAESFLPAFINDAAYEGSTYAIPYKSSIMYFLYNKSVFDEYNLEIPETWDEFIEICDTLLDTDVTPIGFGSSATWYSSWWIGLLNSMMVPADVLDVDYTPETGSFTDPTYTEAIQTFLDMNNAGYFGSHVNSKDYYEVRERFFVGQCAMMLDATTDFTQYDDGMGAENWGYFKLPVMEDAAGDPGAVGGGAEVWIVSSTCEHPDEAITFLKYMTSLEQAKKQTAESGLPNALIEGMTEDNATEALVNAYADAKDYTSVFNWLDCDVEATIADQYMTSISEGFDGKSAEDIMADVQAAAEEVKKAYAD